jgi:hypothetical protein
LYLFLEFLSILGKWNWFSAYQSVEHLLFKITLSKTTWVNLKNNIKSIIRETVHDPGRNDDGYIGVQIW